jgi:hypothetical protein
MAMNNPFANPAFYMNALTAAINLLPNAYGRIEQLGLFPIKPTRFRSLMVEERSGILTLLPTLPLGAPGTVGQRGKRKLRSFVIPHIPHDDVVLPEEVQGVRAFGAESEVQTIAQVLVEHLATMRGKHAITLEYLRMGALKGVILDADGSVLYDLFDEFQIRQKVINFKLNEPLTNVKNLCLSVLRHLEDHLQGEYMNRAHVLCSQEFFDELTNHSSVKEAYQLWQDGHMLRSDMRQGFPFANLTFEEYRGQATDAQGNTRRFIEPGEAHVFPIGTLDTFSTYVAPADFNETVNTLGQPLYAKQEPRKFDRGTDVHTQSNPLPICHRPAVLVKLQMQ